MTKIVAIGGGEIGRTKIMPDGSIFQYPVETMEIDKEIVCLTGKNNPKLLLLATASGDSIEYLNAVRRHFGDTLGCSVSWLELVHKDPSSSKIENAILGTDIIYVGGGNTNNMLKIWREKGVDKLLKEALNNDVVLSGLSAGANCWFKHYITDSTAIELSAEKGTHLSLADGLNFIDGMCAPHTMTETRRLPYSKEILSNKYPNETLFGIDDYSALVFEDGCFRSIVSQVGKNKAAKVRCLSVVDGRISEKLISNNNSKSLKQRNFCR